MSNQSTKASYKIMDNIAEGIFHDKMNPLRLTMGCLWIFLFLEIHPAIAVSKREGSAGYRLVLVHCSLTFILNYSNVDDSNTVIQMVSLYRDPQGEKLFEQHTSQSQSYNVKTNVTTLDASTTKSGTFTATHTVSIKQL